MVDKGSISFAAQFNTKLIELVKEHENLYNHETSTYKDMNMKNDSWDDIASELKTEVNLVKKRWRSLRTEYVRNMKHQRKQRYNGQLSFIDPFINNPKTPNVKKEERLEQAEESMEQIYDMPPHMDNPEHDVIYAVEAEDLESQEHDPENVEDCEYELMEKQMVANEEYYEEEEEPDEQEIYLTNNESFKCTKIEAQSDCSGPIIKRIKTDITDYSEISGQNLSGDIDWDFYRSIAKSITKLTPLAQAQIKGKIFQLVNEADIVHFTKQQ